MSMHLTGWLPTHIEDIEALEELWATFVEGVDKLVGDDKFTGLIAGGDWVGDDQRPAHSFHLTTSQVRTGQRWRQRYP